MVIKLDSEVIEILCCPLCKGAVEILKSKFVCKDCKSEYNKCSINQGECKEYVFDFRINRPVYCIPDVAQKWIEVYKYYEKWHEIRKNADDYKGYLNEIDSLKETYTKELNIKGRVLDVGGGLGKLRHFLREKEVSIYVSIDPYPEIFQNLEIQPNLLRAYPCLREPCNFLLSCAENIPFEKNSFDWVHMGSVLDHFQDPYLALKEAYRILKDDGTLFIGLSIYGRRSTSKSYNNVRLIPILIRIKNKFKKEGFLGLAKALSRKLIRKQEVDDHTFHWKYEDLSDLIRITGFIIEKEQWQKPSFDKVVFLSAKKKQ